MGGRKEQTNKQELVLAPCVRKKKSVTLCILCANASVYSSENYHKVTSNSDLNSRVGQPCICRSTALSSPLSDFCSSLLYALLSSPDCLLLLSFVNCVLLLTNLSGQLSSSAPFCWLPSQGPSFPRFSGIVGDLECRPFVWVWLQSKQRIFLTGTHTHQHNECLT